MLQQVNNLQAERDAIIAEVRAIRGELGELRQSSEFMIDEEAWLNLQTFIKSIKKMRTLQKGAKTKTDLLAVRTLEKLVDRAIEDFLKNT